MYFVFWIIWDFVKSHLPALVTGPEALICPGYLLVQMFFITGPALLKKIQKDQGQIYFSFLPFFGISYFDVWSCPEAFCPWIQDLFWRTCCGIPTLRGSANNLATLCFYNLYQGASLSSLLLIQILIRMTKIRAGAAMMSWIRDDIRLP